ncbi:MAG: peptidoglycan DD-metalloendopeptidase family protein, partial [Elusimicrobiota bacterium]|nr:peptidoglycan DD-metalloendopeptidase family protein [Endomicrobiia bacterium]MDW8166309.1 peptidoglycan DD-metalloendopeptidase family protein [Elusimicrobiota bacterium]
IKPLDGAVICKFGKTQLMKDGYCVLRNGVIIQGMSNSDVVCVEDGKVLFVSNNFRSYGKIVIVEHPNNIHTIYGNLGEITVTEGSWVKKATSIGKADSSGQIYFEIRKDLIPLDPELYFIE